jgi:AraC-like DNA-binding protein
MLLYISILLVIFSIVLIFHNWNINKNAAYLALSLLLIAIYGIAHYVTIYGDSVFWTAIFYNNFSPFMLLCGPFLYFYIRGTLNDKQGLKMKDCLHFIPALIHLIGVIPYYLTSFSYKVAQCNLIMIDVNNIKKIEWNVFFDSKFNFIFRVILLLFYVIYSMILLWKFSNNEKKIEQIPPKQYNITFKWLTFLVVLIFFLVLNYVAMFLYFFHFNKIDIKQSMINTTAFGGFSLLALSLFFFPEVLYGMPTHKKVKNKKVKSQKSIATAPQFSKVEVSPSLNEKDPFFDLYEIMKRYLDDEKPYLNPNFSLAQISLDLGVPQNHVSYCINSLFKTKFSKLRTNLRVEQTKIYLYDSKISKITIDGIAQMAGFSSRSSFYNAFKEETGITPSEYLKIIENQGVNPLME